LHDPYLMKDMDKAARIEKSDWKSGTHISIWDYDVDGTTAVSLVSYLKKVIILK
jgi:single-stranded DNA-specific DHH superfamily exonuclease